MSTLRSTWMTRMASAIIILNVIDLCFTLVYVELGLAKEGNPLMDQALSRSPILFGMAKVALVSSGVFLLWRFRARLTASFALVGMTAAYAAIIGYHLAHVGYIGA